MRGGSDLFSKFFISSVALFLCRFSLTNYLTLLYCLCPLLTNLDCLNRWFSSLMLFAVLIATSTWLNSYLSTSFLSLYVDCCFLSLCSSLSTATTKFSSIFLTSSSAVGVFLTTPTTMTSGFSLFASKCLINFSIAWFLSAAYNSIRCRSASCISKRTLVSMVLEVLSGYSLD